MAVQAASPFVWGAGGARMTPDEISAERKVAQALMQQGMDYSPIQSPWQGAARVAQAMMGGLDSARADAAARANAKAEADLLSDPAIFGLPAQSTAAPAVSTPMGATSIPAGKDEFVNSVMPLAQEASAKTGLDPRLIVAQAALESGWGKSAPGNNLFGIKSHGQPGGNVLPTTEVVNGQPVQTTDSFRAYASPAESVQGYADFITSNPRYKPMMAAQGLEAQAAALGQSGYATDPNYGQKVLQIARSLPTPAAASAATVIGPNDPSPLDTAQWPAGPVGGPSDVAALPEAAQPAQGALPTASAPASPFSGVNPRLLSAMSSPYISDGTKKVLGLVLQKQMEQGKVSTVDLGNAVGVMDARGNIVRQIPKQRDPQFGFTTAPDGVVLRTNPLTGSVEPVMRTGQKPTGTMQEYQAYADAERAAGREPMGIFQYQQALKKAGATSINNQIGTPAPDGKLREELDKGTAKNWTDWQQAGAVSAGQAQDMQLLDELIKVAPQGPLEGRMAEMLPGFSSAGDAFNAIVKRVAPTMRAPGSGSTSDIEYDGMLRSLPALRNKPEANMAISAMMKAKAAINIERAEIISQYSQNQISRNDAEKRISEINKRSIMTPALRQMLAGLGGRGSQPLAGDVVDGFRFKGGDPADKNSWEKVQ